MIAYYFAKDFAGPKFELFQSTHLTALSIIALIAVFLIVMRKIRLESLNNGFRYTLATILVCQETSYHLWNVYIGEWSIQKMLPLHVCSVFVWLSAYMLVSKNRRIYEFAYFLGVSGALQALATPDLGDYGFPHYRFFHMFTSHGSIFIAAMYMTIVERYRPNWKSFGRTLLWLNIYAVVVFLLNLLIGSNYLYVNHKPETASLFDLFGPWPVYLIAAEGIAVIMFTVLYFPFAIKDGVTAVRTKSWRN